MLGGVSYYVYLAYLPAPKAKKPKRHQEVSTPTATATGTTAGGYEEEWIPEHHLKKPKARKTAASSGDEVSIGQTSGTEGRKRKGRK